MRIRSAGNIRCIGELFKLGMLTSIMQHRVKHFLMEEDEGSLEYLCKLLTKVWKELEKKSQSVRTLQ
jgi:hypothetical protein